MPRRALAILLTLVLLLTGFGTIEAASASGMAATAASALDDGSVEDHHLDDLPTHAAGDAGADLVALPTGDRTAAILPREPARYLRAATSVPCAPWLDSPLRPPRLAT